MKRSANMEEVYCRLLDMKFQEKIFGGLVGFQKMGDGYIARCPFHEDTFPTLIINSETPRYFCFACGAQGDWIKFLMNHKDAGFEEAVNLFGGASGMKADISEDNWRRDAVRSDMLESAMTVFKAMLFSEKGASELAYLNSRGYMGEEIEHMGLGLFPGYADARDLLMNDFSCGDVDGLFLSGAGDNPMLAIPYRDACGRLMAIFGMKEGSAGNAYIPLTDVTPVKTTPLLMYRSRNARRLVAVEGFFDAMLSDCIGINGVIGVGKKGLTAGMLNTAAKFGAKEIVLALGSKKNTISAIERLKKRGIKARVVILPEQYDDADAYIRDTCINKFGKLVDKAVTPEEWMRL